MNKDKTTLGLRPKDTIQLSLILARLALILLFLAGLFILILPILAAGAGSLDLSFGNGGVVTTTIGSLASGRAVAIQPDDKIVVVGDSDNIFALARYNNNGGLDSGFGSGGIVTTPIGFFDSAAAVAIQPDGKIVVAGESDRDSSAGLLFDFALARYMSNGSLDSSFGSNGVLTTPIGSGANGEAVALQPNGKIVVAGHSYDGGFTYLALARYVITGSLDSNFGSSGVVTTPIGFSSIGQATALQPDGKIVVAGYSFYDITAIFALTRYTITGNLDSSFGNGGVVTTTIGDSDFGQAVAIQPDGKVVVAGRSFYGGMPSIALARYNSNGSLDSSFGSSGVVTTPTDIGASGQAIALQPDGKIVVAGDYGLTAVLLARYNSNGSLDSSFGSNGIVTTPINTPSSTQAIAIQPDGKILVPSRKFDGGQGTFVLARYIGGDLNPVYLPVILKS